MEATETSAIAHDDVDELRIAVMRLSRRMRAERVTEEVTDTQLSALAALWRNGPQSLGQLAEHERISAPSANRTVNSLVEAGLATRAGSPDDGRKVLIELTPRAIELLESTKSKRVAWFDERFGRLSDAQRALLIEAAPILRELADS